MKKLLRIAGVSLAALLLLAAALLAWALHTESGSRAVLAVARGWLPPGLTIGEVHGTIAGTLRVAHFRYRNPSVGMDLQIDSAELEFSATALLAKRIDVDRAQVDGVLLEFFPATTPAAQPAGPARDPWVAPLDMFVDELRLTGAELRRPGAAPLAIRRAHVAGSWHGANIEARTLEVEGPAGSAALALRIAERAPRLELLRGRFRWRLGEYDWAGTLDASGGRDELKLKASLEAPVAVDVAGTLAVTLAEQKLSAWRAHLAVARFDPHPLVETDAFRTAALELDASGDRVRASLQGVLSLDDQRIVIQRLAATRDAQQLQVDRLELRLNAQPAALTGSANVPLDGFAFDSSRAASAQLQWGEFSLPDAWMGPHFRSSGQLALSTAAGRFAINSKVRLARGERHSTLALRLDGSTDALHIREFELTQPAGVLSVAGDVDLATPARWKLDASARQFDPSLFLDAWPGALNFELHTTGEWPEAGPHAKFKLERLAGRLRGRAISGAGDVAIGPDRKPSGNLQLQSGGASLSAMATPGAQPRIDATLKIAALQEWRPALSGSLEAQVGASGRWPDIELDAKVSAHQIRSGTTRAGTVRAHLSARNARAPRGTFDFSAGDIELAGLRFDETRLKLDGEAAQHSIDFDARGAALSFATHATGAYQKGWSGVVDKLNLSVAPVPPLALTEPTRVVVAHDDFELADTCLAGGDISLCAGARRDGGELTAHYAIKALPLDMLAALAAPRTKLNVQGRLEGNGNMRRTANGVITGSAALTSPTGAFAQVMNDGGADDSLRLEYRDFGVDIELTPASAQARLRGELLKQGPLSGTFSMAVAQDDPALAGEASVELHDLAPLGWWVPQLANLRGSGEIAAQLSGTRAAPRIAFTVRGTGLDAEVPVLGVHLREGNVEASLEPGGEFHAQGSISSGDGSVRLSGARSADQGLELKISGSKFLAASIPGARVTIAPDLSLTGKLGELALTGAVTIEDADVNLEKLSISRSYRASEDVVVVDREVQVKDRAPGLTTDVRILFGERVKLAGFGLESSVAGELRVVEAREQPSRATGEIRLAGTYEAFGRKLNIERGKLIFAGTALDDPQLDILAVRKLQDVTAKLAVTGTAQHPKLDVFTDPAMSQSDAMSYLLTGKPASDVHGEDGRVVQSASQNAGILLGNRLAKRLGGKMSFIDQVGVEQNADLGGSAFTVGKYLSPKLFVSYGVGLFEPGTAVTVRYEISERWSLEANDTPEDQHAGIRYRIEK